MIEREQNFISLLIHLGAIMTFFKIWQDTKDAASWITAGLLGQVIGRTIGPIIVAPFLSPVKETPQNFENSSGLVSDHFHPDIDEEDYSGTQIMYGFAIGSIISFTFGMIFFASHFLKLIPELKKHQADLTSSDTFVSQARKKKIPLLVVICSLQIVFYIGMIIFSNTFGNFLPTYAVEYQGYEKSNAAYLISLYNLVKSVSRFSGMFLVRCSIQILLFLTLSITCIGYIALILFVDMNTYALWICTMVIALGNGNVAPSNIAWTENAFQDQGLAVILYGVGYKLGEVIGPVVIGYILDYISSQAFIFASLVSAMTCFGIVIVQYFLAKQYRKAISKTENSGERTALLAENSN